MMKIWILIINLIILTDSYRLFSFVLHENAFICLLQVFQSAPIR